MRTNELAHLSWTEARDALAADPVVLIPMGTVEQHGPHLPMAADTIVAESVATTAAAGKNVIVTPAINFGYCDNSREFPGTITLPVPLLSQLLEHTIESLANHGARRFIVVNNHRSNAAAVQQCAYDLRARRDLLIGAFFPWGTMISIARKEFPELAGAIGHGGEPETSVMMHLRPFDVTGVPDDAPRSYSEFRGLPVKNASELSVDGFPVNLYSSFSDLTTSGINGDPSIGDSTRGSRLLELTAGVLASFIDKLLTVELAEVPR